MTVRASGLAWIAATLPLAGCGVLPDAYSGCDEVQPYESARQSDPLQVPAGADLPDTRNALKIPEVKAPELPREPGTCLDHPPAYASGAVAGGSAGAAAGDSVAAAQSGTGRLPALPMQDSGPWQIRAGAHYEPTTDVDFDGGSTAEFNSSTGFLFGLGYSFTEHFEVGANITYGERDYEARLAGDEPDEVFPAQGTIETSGVMFDLSYYFLTGRIRPFVVAGAGWNFVDTNVATAPPQVGCWWNPWYGYICEGFQETKDVDSFAYQAGAGIRYRVGPTFSMSGSYRMNWVDFPKADGTPTFDAIQFILHWAF
jgi:opacity protein-like surface antigen